jgi:hypothetical protein
MTIVIETPPGIEATLAEVAAREGLTPEAYALRSLLQQISLDAARTEVDSLDAEIEDMDFGGLPVPAPTAEELLKLPSEERNRILDRQWEFAARFYEEDMAKPVHERELTAFSALDGEPFHDDDEEEPITEEAR